MLTDFQKRLLNYLERALTGLHNVNAWKIAQEAFPEKWAKKSGRGILIVHIDNAVAKMENKIGRIGAKNQFCSACYYLKERQ